jgi:hypothetical protein
LKSSRGLFGILESLEGFCVKVGWKKYFGRLMGVNEKMARTCSGFIKIQGLECKIGIFFGFWIYFCTQKVVKRVYGPVDLKQPSPPWTSVMGAAATSLEACASVAMGTGDGRGARKRGSWGWGMRFGSHRMMGGDVVGRQR